MKVTELEPGTVFAYNGEVFIKTIGKYVYSLTHNRMTFLDLQGDKPEIINLLGDFITLCVKNYKDL